VRLAIWSPLPPAASGIADYVAESLPTLARGAAIETVSEEPREGRPPAELDVYHVGNSPAHGYIYRAALRRPGVVVLHDWNLHYLVLSETVERGDVTPYLREMRRAYRDEGAFVGRQVAQALGGEMLPSLYPLNERLLESSLAAVALSRTTAEAAQRALPGRPVLHLPMHYAPPAREEGRAAARRALGMPDDALVVVVPGLATAAKRIDVLLRVASRLRARVPRLLLVVAGGVDARLPLGQWITAAGLEGAVRVTGRVELGDFVRHLEAADVVVALRFPSFGEMSAALVRAMGLGRPVLVTAGTPLATEMPEGTVVPVDPGPHEEAELAALLGRLLEDAPLRESIGRLARDHVREVHDLARTSEALLRFLEDVAARKAELVETVARAQAAPQTLKGYFEEELRFAAKGLGLASLPAGVLESLEDLPGKAGATT
jgi:glycosyltransferase involved in cell wall biosynthesis